VRDSVMHKTAKVAGSVAATALAIVASLVAAVAVNAAPADPSRIAAIFPP
jgi:hypothetical protein